MARRKDGEPLFAMEASRASLCFFCAAISIWISRSISGSNLMIPSTLSTPSACCLTRSALTPSSINASMSFEEVIYLRGESRALALSLANALISSKEASPRERQAVSPWREPQALAPSLANARISSKEASPREGQAVSPREGQALAPSLANAASTSLSLCHSCHLGC